MNALELVLGFDLSHPPGLPRANLKKAWELAYSPLLVELEARATTAVSLRVSGAVLDYLEQEQPEGIERLRRLVERGQVEIVGGAYYDAVLSALPERDAIGQIRLCCRRWKHLVGIEPEGAYLTYGAWDPGLPRILARAGMRFAVLDASAFQLAGLSPDDVDGHFITEREGLSVAVFPDYRAEDPVSPGMDPARVLGLLRRYATRKRRSVVWMLDARELGVRPGSAELAWGRSGGWLPRLFGRLASQDHWLKLASFGSLLQRYRPTGRVYLPATMDPALQATATVPPHTRPQRPGTAATLSNHDARRAPAMLPWDAFLSRYEEANRLHKRMLVTSREVARLATHVRTAGRRPGAASMARGLEKSLLWLYQAQSAAAYTHDPWAGIHDGRLRHRAYSALLRAEQHVQRIMGEPGRFLLERTDVDCDGRDELVISTPNLRAMLDPARGGALVELDALDVGANAVNTFTRRTERIHEALGRGDDLPSLVAASAVSAGGVAAVFTRIENGDPEDDSTEETPVDGTVPRLGPVELAVDLHPRLTFVDHFLGRQASLHGLQRQQYPECGDFVGAEYQVLRAEPRVEEGRVTVQLARDGSVAEDGVVRLVRVAKRFDFGRDESDFELVYEISNRSHDPLESRFAVELNLNIDSSPERSGFLALDERTVPLDAPSQAQEVSELRWGDLRRGLQIRAKLDTPAEVWHYPVRSLHDGLEGPELAYQGACLTLVWPLRLWGLERRTFRIHVGIGTTFGGAGDDNSGVFPGFSLSPDY